jgi:hypothetical protein
MLLGLAALVGVIAMASSASAAPGNASGGGGAANLGPADLSVRFHSGAEIETTGARRQTLRLVRIAMRRPSDAL